MSTADPADTCLWLLPEHAVEPFVRRVDGLRLLTSPERERMERKHSAAARRRQLGARVLCRYALSARTGRPLDDWRFTAGPFGRPEVSPDPGGVRFNLSHTDGLIACVVTVGGRECGVDIEPTPAGADAVTHIPRHLAEGERAALANAPPGGRASRLAAYWVLKEAYLKALGVGMHRGLDGFTFSDPCAGPVTVDDPEHGPEETARWTFDLAYPSPGHVLAVAVRDAADRACAPALLHRFTLTG